MEEDAALTEEGDDEEEVIPAEAVEARAEEIEALSLGEDGYEDGYEEYEGEADGLILLRGGGGSPQAGAERVGALCPGRAQP